MVRVFSRKAKKHAPDPLKAALAPKRTVAFRNKLLVLQDLQNSFGIKRACAGVPGTANLATEDYIPVLIKSARVGVGEVIPRGFVLCVRGFGERQTDVRGTVASHLNPYEPETSGCDCIVFGVGSMAFVGFGLALEQTLEKGNHFFLRRCEVLSKWDVSQGFETPFISWSSMALCAPGGFW